jgi:predicted phosphodiesterase
LKRYGVIADVHGNLRALEAVLAAMGEVDGWLCAGDLVGYGPRPNECVERVAGLPGLVVVAGNHDLMAVDRLPLAGLGPLPLQTLEWTRRVLGREAREWLSALPLRASTPDRVEMAHGSLDDPTEYVRDCDAAAAQSARVPHARALVLGHTHHPLCCGRVLNPGSVGQSRERRPVARALSLERGGEPCFLTFDYDVRATRAELREAGLPVHACHLAPGRRAKLARRLRSLI